MKNVPHQINDLVRMREVLQIFSDLEDEGEDLSDDGVVGRRAVIEGAYGFRDKSLTVEQALALEAEKPKSSRGTRTFARDLRRLFALLGFLKTGDDEIGITEKGAAFLRTSPDSDEERAIMREALLALSLSDEDGTSHPYQILLNLVEQVPGIETPKLALALEAADDSQEEFERILKLAASNSWQADLDASDYMIRNAIKILPALGRQIGDIVSEGGGTFLARRFPRHSWEGEAGGGGGASALSAGSRKHRKVSAATIASAPLGEEESQSDAEYGDPAAAAAARLARLDRHNQLVRSFAGVLEAAGFDLTEDPYDVLGTKAEDLVLGEAKTLDETFVDERSQIRRAVGQLLYYDFFELPKESDRVRVCILERTPSEAHQEFLRRLDILPCWVAEDELQAPEWVTAKLSKLGITLVVE